MTIKKIKKQIKENLKILALEVRETKLIFKQAQRDASKLKEIPTSIWTVIFRAETRKNTLKSSFRHKHIARCLLRGRSYKQIERKVSFDNPLNIKEVNRYIEQFCGLLNLEEYPVYIKKLTEEGKSWNLEKSGTSKINPKLKNTYLKVYVTRPSSETLNKVEKAMGLA